jgi:hypothetical protein
VAGNVITASAVIAVCSLIAWLAWLLFNYVIYRQTRDAKVFEQTSKVAKAFRDSSVAGKVKRLGSSVAGRARRNQTVTRASSEPDVTAGSPGAQPESISPEHFPAQ